MTKEQLIELLKTSSLEDITKQHIFNGTPHVFADNPAKYDEFRAYICDGLDLMLEDITIIGSGKIGFSLSPNSFGRQFSKTSDIDVLIVSEEKFDEIWKALLKWHYPKKVRISNSDKRLIKRHQESIYWGWMQPAKLFLVRDLTAPWFETFQSLSRYAVYAGRKFEARLYRTWDHALCYHVNGLRQVRNIIE